jgi:uncharacterized membrane protein YdjX (TVP38/TMEM64 family)
MQRVWIFGGIIAVLVLAVTLLPVVDWLQAFLAWVQANPGISWIVFILVYVAATVFMLPGSVLTLGAGFLFGLTAGFFVVSAASTLGAACAFLVGRFFVRDWVESKLGDMPRFNALDRAVGERGWLIVGLTRLSPIFPFNLLNYALGVTRVPFWQYVLASWIGMMPGTVLYVYLGSVGQNLTALFSGELPGSEYTQILFYGGLAATLLLTIVITRIATRALNQQLETA